MSNNNQYGMRNKPSGTVDRKGPRYCPQCKADTMGALLTGNKCQYRRCNQCGFEKHENPKWNPV